MTTPNPYGQFPAGALSDATNCVMRNPGELQAAPSFTNYTPISTAGTNDFLRLMVPLDSGHVFSFTHDTGPDWKVSEGVPGGTVNAGTFPSIASISATSLFSKSRISSTRSRDRMLVNSNRGVMVGDVMAPASTADRTLRWAGLPQPQLAWQSISGSASSPIPTGVMVAYTAVYTREFSDGYIVKSIPAPPFKYLNNTGGPIQITNQIDLSPYGVSQAGDYIEIYRTDGLATASIDADPGSTFKLVQRYKLTAADITAGFVNITDSQAMIAPYYVTPGRELYTNPYQEGSTGGNRQPDICGAMATFKGFTFYGNITERAQWTLAVPAGVNDGTTMAASAYKRANGVGQRTLSSGTATSGSPTITAVSAADIVGIVPGQQWVSSSVFSFASAVLSVGASTITLGSNASSSGSVVGFAFADILEVDGVVYRLAGINSLFGSPIFELTSNQTYGIANGADNSGVTIVFEHNMAYGSYPAGSQNITVRGTHGANYSPPIPEYNATVLTVAPVTTPNLLRWSKDSEPEHVPSVNETQVGSASIIALATTKDALWIACMDGVYRLSGDGGVWRVDLVAPGLVLCAPRCMVNMRETIYAYTNYGFGAITDSGFVPISHTRIRSLLPGPPFAETADLILGRNDVEGEVIISPGVNAFTHYVWNTFTQGFTRVYDQFNHFIYTTAFAWQESPASGAQAFLWGVSELAAKPALFQWNSATAYLSPGVTFTPFYGDAPFQTKQWIDITYMFMSEASGYTLTASLANAVVATPVPIVAAQGGGDAVCTVGVPRKYAIAPKIIVGFGIASSITTNRVLLEGVSVRYAAIGPQQVTR
jgi:hypothetical protein